MPRAIRGAFFFKKKKKRGAPSPKSKVGLDRNADRFLLRDKRSLVLYKDIFWRQD